MYHNNLLQKVYILLKYSSANCELVTVATNSSVWYSPLYLSMILFRLLITANRRNFREKKSTYFCRKSALFQRRRDFEREREADLRDRLVCFLFLFYNLMSLCFAI